ncbi:MAG: DUF2796 domain-containing protein [Limnobacter sp.]|nr:DUF2796 domain-containing protein [Limnobacter sp.]
MKHINCSMRLLEWGKSLRIAVLALPFVAVSLSTAVLAQQLPAHVHGVARLELIAQGTELSVSLLSPLDNWVGFEHAPRNAAQKAAIEKAKSDIATKELIAFNPEALCKLKRAEFEPGLPKTHSHKGDVHAESEASWEFHCEQPDLLKELRLPLFKAYPRFAKIQAAAADADGQSAGTLTAKSPTLRLP